MSKDIYVSIDGMSVVSTNANTYDLQTIDDYHYYNELPFNSDTKYSLNKYHIKNQKKRVKKSTKK